jgi:hypothetical protein
MTCLIGGPAQAFERLTLEDCNMMLAAVAELTVKVDYSSVDIDVSSDGWCRLRVKNSLPVPVVNFDTLDWQIDGLQALIETGKPPMALALRVAGLRGFGPRGETTPAGYDLELTLRQVPEQHLLLIEGLTLKGPEGPVVSLGAVIGGAFFDSQAMLVTSLPGLRINDLSAAITFDGRGGPFDLGFLTSRPGDLALARSLADGPLTMEQFSQASRGAYLDFLDDLPTPLGTLDLRLQSERGLGMLQLVQLDGPSGGHTAETLERGVEIALSGASVDMNWRAGAR